MRHDDESGDYISAGETDFIRGNRQMVADFQGIDNAIYGACAASVKELIDG